MPSQRSCCRKNREWHLRARSQTRLRDARTYAERIQGVDERPASSQRRERFPKVLRIGWTCARSKKPFEPARGRNFQMDLENKYEAAQSASDAMVANIRRTCSAFMSKTPEYLPTARNEALMFQTMEEHDELSPTSVVSWSLCFDLCRNELEQRPAARKQTVSAPTTGLTYAEIDGWSSVKLQKEIESSPRRAAEIEFVLSNRKR